jgi:hypothetical protein
MEHADRGCGWPRSRRRCPGSRGSAPRRRRRRRRRDRAGWSLRMLLIGKRVDPSEVILSNALSRRQVWIAYISPPRPTCAAAACGGPQKHRIRASRHGSRAATAGLVRRDGSDGTRTRDLRRDGPVLVLPGWPGMTGDLREKQGSPPVVLRGFAGAGKSFRRPRAGYVRDASLTRLETGGSCVIRGVRGEGGAGNTSRGHRHGDSGLRSLAVRVMDSARGACLATGTVAFCAKASTDGCPSRR